MAVRVAGGAGELPLEGDVRAVEELLAPADVRPLLRPAEIDARDGLRSRDVDHGQRVVERVGDPRRRAVRGDRDAARVVLHRDAGDHELATRRRASSGSTSRRSSSDVRFSERQQLLDVDHRDLVRAGARDEGLLPVGRERDVGDVGEVALRLVEQHLVDAPVLPEDGEAVRDRPALEDARHRHEVLRAVERGEGELAARVPGDAEQQVRLRHDPAVRDPLAGHVEDRDLGHRRRCGTCRSARARSSPAAACRRARARPTTGCGSRRGASSPCPVARSTTETASKAVPITKSVFPAGSTATPCGSSATGRFRSDLPRRHVDHGDAVVEPARDVGRRPVGAEDEVGRLAADRDLGDLHPPRRVDDDDAARGLAGHPDLAPVGAEREVDGVLVLDRELLEERLRALRGGHAVLGRRGPAAAEARERRPLADGGGRRLGLRRVRDLRLRRREVERLPVRARVAGEAGLRGDRPQAGPRPRRPCRA